MAGRFWGTRSRGLFRFRCTNGRHCRLCSKPMVKARFSTRSPRLDMSGFWLCPRPVSALLPWRSSFRRIRHPWRPCCWAFRGIWSRYACVWWGWNRNYSFQGLLADMITPTFNKSLHEGTLCVPRFGTSVLGKLRCCERFGSGRAQIFCDANAKGRRTKRMQRDASAVSIVRGVRMGGSFVEHQQRAKGAPDAQLVRAA